MRELRRPSYRLAAVVAAWLVHGLTASGAMFAFMALLAVNAARWSEALIWLAAALVVDAIDGPLARWVRVDRVTPRIAGSTLDLVVDFLTYVFVPGLFIYRAGLAPPALAAVAVALILVSSLYHYARTDLKTGDNYFRGFPAYWNVVAFYLFVCQLPPAVGFAVICVFAVLTFLPVLFVHPIRVRDYRPLLPVVLCLWAFSSLALLVPAPAGADSSVWHTLALASSLACLVILFAVGLVRTFRGAPVGAA